MKQYKIHLSIDGDGDWRWVVTDPASGRELETGWASNGDQARELAEQYINNLNKQVTYLYPVVGGE